MEERYLFNEHNKAEYPPMHTAEHVINATMDKLYGCGRSVSAHIERKKSKLDYKLPKPLSDEEVRKLEETVNAVLAQDLPVTYLVIPRSDAPQHGVDVSRLPADASEMVRIVKVGDYDTCLCLGTHVSGTARCGQVRITTHSYEEGRWRMRFKLEGDAPE